MIQFLAKNSSQMSSITVGSEERIIYVTDTEEILIEKNGIRTQFRDVIYLASHLDLPVAPLNKIYFSLDDKLLRYYNNGWQVLNQTVNSLGNAITIDFGSRLGDNSATRLKYGRRI